MRTSRTYPFDLTDATKERLLRWAKQFHEVVWLDSNHHTEKLSTYKAVLAVDELTSIKTEVGSAFETLDEYQKTTNDWLFGYLTYDLKNELEDLSSDNFDGLQFPDLFFFQPKKLFLFSEGQVEICYLNMVADELESDWEDIMNGEREGEHTTETAIRISLRTSRDSYFEKVNEMLARINRGDIYEANFCQEFFAEEAHIDPIKTFEHLNAISRAPFTTFFKHNSHYLLSASPERYLKKTGDQVISQPIKGTAKRGTNPRMDAAMAHQLRTDPKERSENIMITDLVRNDLSRIAEKGSVEVKELCKVYTFEQVHQLISTVACRVSKDVSPVDVIRNTFPMGSMTGAPKISAMQIIEALEDARRGLYSGTVGYFTPDGDMDFNVIIRSILYNASRAYVSFSVGGAITAQSTPENEYEECLLKAKAMREVLE